MRVLNHAVALIASWVIAAPASGSNGITRSIRVMSDPPAEICEVLEGRMACFAKSPALVTLRFRETGGPKRLHLKRIGYETKPISVSPDDAQVHATLKQRPLYVDLSPAAPRAFAEVRQSINERIREIFFQDEPPAGLRGFEFIGGFSIAQTAHGAFEVIVPIVVDDSFRVQHLGPISRRSRPEDRPAEIARALWEVVVHPLSSSLRAAFEREKRVENITLAVNYARTRYVFVDENSTFQFSTKAWVGSRLLSYGSQVQRVDEYRVSTFQLPTGYQQLSATKQVFVAVFVVPAAGTLSLESVKVLSNDHKDGALILLRTH